MPRVTALNHVRPGNSFRVARVCGQFDLPRHDVYPVRIEADLPIEELPDWQIGAIIGASGAGKSTVAREVFGADQVFIPDQIPWDDTAVIDACAPGVSVDAVVQAFISVGLSSAPVWLRPYRALSMGERARASLARLLLEQPSPLVIDEFTSTVDRVVARAMSVAVARHVRSQADRQFVAVSCHRDIVPWLAPDWVLDLDAGVFLQRPVERRPPIELRIYPGDVRAWPLFARYHYMSGQINRMARVFLASVTFGDEPETERLAGFFSLIPVMGKKGEWRGHRTVVLADFQGLGIGNRMVEDVADWLWEREGKRYRATTSAPNLIAYRRKHPDKWVMTSGPRNAPPPGKTGRLARERSVTSAGRLTTSWLYIPRALRGTAVQVSVPVASTNSKTTRVRAAAPVPVG